MLSPQPAVIQNTQIDQPLTGEEDKLCENTLDQNMAEVIYATPNMMTNARYTQGEGEERIVAIYANVESLGDQQQGPEQSSESLGTGRSQWPDAVSPPRCLIMAVAVLLVLLSVVLLARLLGLAVKYETVMEKTASMERDMEQLRQRLKNLTEQRDKLLCQQDCSDGWDKFWCKCYRLYNVQESWNKSRELCVSHGADLVVVDSKEELEFINRYRKYFWLGATDEAAEGTWRWVDGTVLSLDNPSWSRGGPGGGEDRNCLMLTLYWEQNHFKWADERCEAIELAVFCENH